MQRGCLIFNKQKVIAKRRKNNGRKNHRSHRINWSYGLSDQTFKLTGNAQ